MGKTKMFYQFIKLLSRGLFILCVGLFLAGSPLLIESAEAQKKVRLFGTGEIKSDKLKKFSKWTGVLGRYAVEVKDELKKCKLSATNKCMITKWRIFLNKIKSKPPAEQMELVNQYLNKWLYIIDPTNYQKKDYWATPKQFVNRNGDCEDYAIAKYASLLHLGFKKEEMRIVVLQDLNLKVPHAVLAVYVDDKALILDNQISRVIDAERIKHYKPIFSLNEKSWWLHRG